MGSHLAAGRYEPALTIQLLPRCGVCGAPHPQARGIISDKCMDCGEAIPPPPRARTAKAVLTWRDPFAAVARVFFAIADFLHNLAKGAR